MATNNKILATLPVVDLNRAEGFYKKYFRCDPQMATVEGAFMSCPGGEFYVYKRGPSKADHTLASFLVDDIESEVNDLRRKGLKFEEYNIPEMGIKTINGISTRGDTKGAWFKDSEGNILSLTQVTMTGGSKEHSETRGEKVQKPRVTVRSR